MDDRQKIAQIYKNDPEKFLIDCLDVDKKNIWDKMREIIHGVKNHPKVAVKAGHSVSKTYTAARIALWFLYTHFPATVVTTAPTNKLVEDVLWREIRDAHARAKVPLGGELLKTKLDLGEKWFATGFSTRPETITKEATGFQGYHNENVLVIFDEAAGIAKEIWDAAESLQASGHCRFLAIGNPTSSRGEFVRCFRDPEYKKITISVLDTPNYKNDEEAIPGLSGRSFVARIKRRYGEESNYYKARVLGEIPEDDVDTIIRISDYEKACKREILSYGPKRRFIAGDPADGGDESVFYLMEETNILDELIFQRKGTMQTAGRVKVFSQRNNRGIEVNWYVGDSIGIGKGVSDKLRELGMNVIDVISSERQRSGVPEIYFNRRAQLWSEGGDAFADEDIVLNWEDEILREQLTSVKQTIRNGRILVEDKKIIRKDLGRSCDRADAYLIGLFGRKRVPLEEKSGRPDRYAKRPKKASVWAG